MSAVLDLTTGQPVSGEPNQSPPERHIVTEREDEDPDEGGMTAEKAAALIPREYG